MVCYIINVNFVNKLRKIIGAKAKRKLWYKNRE